jgi:SPP1 gp7 family putative phage head morphogenesis protein
MGRARPRRDNPIAKGPFKGQKYDALLLIPEAPRAALAFRSAKDTGVGKRPSPQAKKVGPISMKFDQANPRAIAWARERSSKLIAEIEKDTLASIRALIADGIESGRPPRRTAVLLREVIGLTSVQGEQLAAYADALEESGWQEGDIEDEVSVRAGEMYDRRAETIARTETMAASNEGQQELWEQAVDEGLLTGFELREWIVTPDDRLCPICEAMEGATVAMGEPFDVDGEETMVPPAHPNCRCTIGISAESPGPAALEAFRAAWPDSTGHDDHGRGDGGGTLTEAEGKMASAWASADATVYGKLRDPKSAEGKAMSALLEKLPAYGGTAYRGATLRDRDIEKLTSAKGAKISLHSSASQDEEVAAQFMGQAMENSDADRSPVIIEFRNAGAREIGHLFEGTDAAELEVVIPAGTTYDFRALVHEAGYTRVILEGRK